MQEEIQIEKYDREKHCGFGTPIFELVDLLPLTKNRKDYMRVYRTTEKYKKTKKKSQKNWVEKTDYNKKYYEKNRDKRLAQSKEWLNQNKDKRKSYIKGWAGKNKEKIKGYHEKNKEKNPTAIRLRNLVWIAMKRYTKTGKIASSKEYGINYEAIIEHLKPFPADLSKYHIDHIKPLCSFDLTKPEEVKKAFAPENHQWLTIEENLKKGGRILCKKN